MMGKDDKGPSLGPGLFDPEIPVGESDEGDKVTPSGKLLLSMEQSAVSFNMFDKDGDGQVDLEELSQLATSLGAKWSDARTRQVFWIIDTNKDGLVSFGEFYAWYSEGNMESITAEPEPEEMHLPSQNLTKEAVKNLFQMFDANANDRIESNELQELLEALGYKWEDDRVAEVMNRLGSPVDGAVSFKEFYAWFLSGIDFIDETSSRNQTQVIVDPSEEDALRIFVRGFPWKAKEGTAFKYFQSRCGEVMDVKMINWSRDGTPSGRCVVTFAQKSSVEKAMSLHRNRMGSRWLEVYRVNEGDREEVHKVDRSKHGALIGIKGQKVKEMQAESGARIFFESSPQSVMVIKGRDHERARAWAMAQAIIAENVAESHSVDALLHGRLIGSGGKLKKMMEEESGAHIVYRTEPKPRCEIYGNEEARKRAWQLIQGKMWELQHSDEERFPMAKKYHGTLVGKSSIVMRTLEEQTGARIRLTDEEIADKDGKMVKGVMICRGTDYQKKKALELAKIMIKELPPLLSDLREEDFGLGSLGALPLSPNQMWATAVDSAMEKGGWVKKEESKVGEQAANAQEDGMLML